MIGRLDPQPEQKTMNIQQAAATFLELLRDSSLDLNRPINLSDADICQCIADALEVLDPDTATEEEEGVAEAAPHLAIAFSQLADELRQVEAEYMADLAEFARGDA